MSRRRPSLIALILAPPFVAGLLLAPAGAADETIPRNIAGPGDYALREQIVYQLGRDPELAGERLSVLLVNGGAVFSGTISGYALKMRLLRLTGFIRGIVNVTDEMVVGRADLTDEALRDAVAAILMDAAESIGLSDLDVRVEDAVVTLRGRVNRFPDRIQAEELTGSVLGVTRVINLMTAKDVPPVTAERPLAHAVADYLLDFRAFPHLGQIEVSESDGVVTLGGRVSFFYTRRQAEVMVGLIEGVRRVENRIAVDPSLTLTRPDVKVIR